MFISDLVKKMIIFGSTNKTAIKAGIAMGGVVLTGASSAIAAIQSKEELEKMKFENKDKAPTKTEQFLRVGKYWIKTAVIAGGTIYLIYSVNDDGNKAIASLAAAYSMKDGELKDYKDKVYEIAGKKKAEDIRDSIEIDKVQQNPPREEAIENTGNGQTLIYDRVMGSYFRSDMQSVREAVNDINTTLIEDGYACLNDFYQLLGRKDLDIGDDLGWIYDPSHETLEVLYTSTLTDSGTPVMVISYNLTPIYVKTGAWSRA